MTAKIDQFNKDLLLDMGEAFDIHMYEHAGEGTYIGWTYLHQMTRYDLENMKKDMLEALDYEFFEIFDSINETYKEKKVEIKDKLEEIEITIDEMEKKLIENKEDIAPLTEITKYIDELKELIKDLTLD